MIMLLLWGATSYGHLLEPILLLRPGVLMKGFFITFGLPRGGSAGQRRERRGGRGGRGGRGAGKIGSKSWIWGPRPI